MDVNKLFFARLMPTRPGNLGKILADQIMMPLPDKLRAGAGGLILGQPEGFATLAARDAAVGPCGKHRMSATSWHEVEESGFTPADVAIGHRLGDLGFDRVAKPVIDAVAGFMVRTSYPGVIAIARTRYGIDFGDYSHTIVDVSWFGLTGGDKRQIAVTAQWLQKVFTARLFHRSIAKFVYK